MEDLIEKLRKNSKKAVARIEDDEPRGQSGRTKLRNRRRSRRKPPEDAGTGPELRQIYHY